MPAPVVEYIAGVEVIIKGVWDGTGRLNPNLLQRRCLFIGVTGTPLWYVVQPMSLEMHIADENSKLGVQIRLPDHDRHGGGCGLSLYKVDIYHLAWPCEQASRLPSTSHTLSRSTAMYPRSGFVTKQRAAVFTWRGSS